MEQTLQQLLENYVKWPDDAEINADLAYEYEKIGQLAAAVSYYIRAAERSKTPFSILAYECLIRAAMCFEKMGTRGLSVRGLLQRAITLCPYRPEAYFFLARWYEREKTVESWMNCYTIASQGVAICTTESFESKFTYPTEYPGDYGLLFEKAVSAWWVGLCEESKNLMIELHSKHKLDRTHRTAVINNLQFFNQFRSASISNYSLDKDWNRLRTKFLGAETITRNYSEAYQDMFVLTMHSGRRGGTYLEIGSAHPHYGNNTALLEEFGWKGISIDIDPKAVEEFNKVRKNKAICTDATQIDYFKLLEKMPHDIDYLQIDIDPADVSLKVLKMIPFDKHRFGVITFEHDAYTQVDDTVRVESRKYLESLGYTLLVPNVAPDDWRYYEDWWISDSIPASVVHQFHHGMKHYYWNTLEQATVRGADVILERKITDIPNSWASL